MDGSIPPPSTTTTTTSTPSTTTIPTSSSSTVFRPRKSEDWNEYRTAIENLYRDNQLKLRDVKRIMERDYNFVASYSLPFLFFTIPALFPAFPSLPRICHSAIYGLALLVPLQKCSVPFLLPPKAEEEDNRLAAWHVRKNIKAKEVHVMIRKQQKRAARGKQTGFRVAGQEVDSKRISRFVRRYGSNMEANNAREDPPHSPQGHQIIQPVQPVQPIQATSPEPETPSDMSYFTPPPEERAMTLSPSTETPSHFHDDPPEPGPDGWMTLEMFQEKLLKLSRTLDQSMSRFSIHGLNILGNRYN
ncbi:hypothetical protein CBS147343_9438 [Aspergillus niger]|nr:hypothetical protein CBS133816_10155 [Aspergillus niger]KAI2843961.1 hypothetical protein CBS11350_5073 [Aspergillus niger]KAI2865605.1 hypothetical protein CBS12448_1902 [Aspergillus niger]KAI2931406.1 hypothetical protein CBS147321_10258 [Aspergillus niger]KAI2970678.1 hypothetical protein CBS147324_5369 [Aspergillus niger]